MAALVAADAGEAFGKVAALHELVDHFRDHTAQHAIARLIVTRIRGDEALEVRVKTKHGHSPKCCGISRLPAASAFIIMQECVDLRLGHFTGLAGGAEALINNPRT